MSDEAESRVKRATALLEQRMSQMHSYHDHKETMAHAALLVALAYVGAIASVQSWPPDWIPTVCAHRNVAAMIGAMAGWLFIHVYMRWQLRNRRAAALYVACLLKVLRRWAHTPPTDPELKPYMGDGARLSGVHMWVDYFIVSKAASIPSDEGLKGYPKAMVDEYMATETGALFGENLVTWGSIALGLVLLTRTWP